MPLRAIGPLNAVLPVPTGMIQGFMRDPDNLPYQRYCQFIPAPGVAFTYYRIDPDAPSRLPDINDFAWAYDDYAPSGRGFTVRAELIEGRVKRWAFPYQIGDQTIRSWEQAGLKPEMLFNRLRASHARLHQAQRAVTALATADWGANTGTPQSVLGTSNPVYFQESSGVERLPSGNPNPNYASILSTFQAIKRRMHLATNGAVDGSEMIAVLPPVVATAIARSGEMREFLKQSQYARDLINPNVRDWNLPPEYGGYKLVVEDTVRCFMVENADGTVANVANPAEKDYILNTDTIYFVSRPGGLDGQYGFQNFSTIQIYQHRESPRFEARSDPWNNLVEGRFVIEDAILTPALIAGFALTGVLSGGQVYVPPAP